MDPRAMGYTPVATQTFDQGFTILTFTAKNGTVSYGVYEKNAIQIVTRHLGDALRAVGMRRAGTTNAQVMRSLGGR